MKYLKLFLTILCLIYGTKAFSQQISGRIVDGASKEALVGAHVMMKQNWRVGTITDAEGSFSLTLPDSLKAQNPDFIISFIGFRELVISAEELRTRNVISLSQNKESMQEVTVVADKLISDEYSVREINRMEVYRNPGAKGDALLAVNALPSSTTLDESANVSFRGAGPNQTGIFFNGVPIYNAVRFSQLNGIGTFSLFNTEILAGIDVFAGNPPLEFGNVSGGLIAIESRDRIPKASSSSLLLSMASIGVNHTTPMGEQSSLTVYSNYQLSALLKHINREALSDINEFGSIDAGLHFVRKTDNGSQLKFFNYTLREGYDVGFRSPTYSGSYKQTRFRNFSVANAVFPVSEDAVIAVNSGYSYSDFDLAFSRSAYKVITNNLYTSLNYHKEKKRSSFKFGVSYDGEYQRFDGIVPQFEYAIRPDDPHLDLSEAGGRSLLEPYAYYKYAPSRIISFAYSLRSNIPVGGLDSYLSYQSNIKYDPKNPHLFRLSRGKMHQYLAEFGGNEYELISSRQLSLDHEYEKGKWLGTHSFFFNRNEKGEINSRVLGFETSWRYRFASQSFIELAYTGLDVRETQDESSNPGPYDIDYFIRLAGQYEFGRNWSVGMRGLFRQGQRYQAIESASFDSRLGAFRPQRSNEFQRLPPYNILDINLSKLVPVNENMVFVFFASASNAFNFENIRGYTYNFDYTNRQGQLFSRRTYYFGFYINFQ